MARITDQGTWRLTSVPAPAGTLLLRLDGEVDASACSVLEAEFDSRATGSVDAILDLRDVSLLSIAATGVLTRLADRLAEDGRRLLVVTGRGMPHRVLEAIHAVDVLEVFTTVATATASLAGGRPRGEDPAELTRLRSQVHDLREKLRTRPLVARALGVLQERYALPDAHTANSVLREVSQRHNVKMRALAHAFLVASPPRSATAPLWFPGRVRPPAPAVTFTERQPTSRAAFLDAVLDAVLASVSAPAGTVQLLDPVLGGLTVERHRGLPAQLVEFLDHCGAARSSCATALRRGTRTVVADVMADRSQSDEYRAVLLAAGSRTVQSTPLRTPGGDRVGVVCAHHRDPGRVPGPAECAELDRIGDEAGAWLDWQVTTSTLDALEHLHRQARQVRGDAGAPRPRRPGAAGRR